MFEIERWQEIFDTLRKNKLRTILTGISVASGIFILVVLLGFSSGIQNGVEEQFSDDAKNEISIRTGRTTKSYKGLNPNRYIQLKNEDFNEVNQDYDNYLEYRSANYSIWGSQVVYKNEVGNFSVRGVHPDFQFIEASNIVEGRFINQSDIEQARKIIVIGTKVKSEMFKNQNPIGEVVSVFGINFTIVGVYSDPGGAREEDNVYVPISSAQIAFNGSDNIRGMSFTVPMLSSFNKTLEVSNALTESIEAQIKQKYMVSPDDRSAVRIGNTLERAKKIYGLSQILSLVF
jgi:putative ABC transport system permease protein